MSKKGNYSKYIKEQNLILYDPNYAFHKNFNNFSAVVYYYGAMNRNIELTPEVRQKSIWGINKFIYIDKYTVADIFGLVDQSYQYQYKHGSIKIKWDKMLNTYRFLVDEFQKRTGRPIGFYREYFKKSTNTKDEEKIADYLDMQSIILLGEELFNWKASIFRNDLNTKIMYSIYRNYGSSIRISEIPFIDHLNKLANAVMINEEADIKKGF